MVNYRKHQECGRGHCGVRKNNQYGYKACQFERSREQLENIRYKKPRFNLEAGFLFLYDIEDYSTIIFLVVTLPSTFKE